MKFIATDNNNKFRLVVGEFGNNIDG